MFYLLVINNNLIIQYGIMSEGSITLPIAFTQIINIVAQYKSTSNNYIFVTIHSISLGQFSIKGHTASGKSTNGTYYYICAGV